MRSTDDCRRFSRRTGAVYIAVLGSALIVSVLAFSALALQRLQNRRLDASADVHQAKLNADSAVALGLLLIQQDDDWRNTFANTTGAWFTRATGAGTCSLLVTDPLDDDLNDDPNDPFVLTGIGTSGSAVQRIERYVDPRAQAADALHAAANAGGSLSGQSDLDWSTIVAQYQAFGTEINVNSLTAISSINLAKNPSFETNTAYWTGNPPTPTGWAAATQITRVSYQGHTACLRIERTNKTAGALQYIDHSLKPGTTYTVSLEVYVPTIGLHSFRIYLYVRANGETHLTYSDILLWSGDWRNPTVNLMIPATSWIGDADYAFVMINSNTDLGTSVDFYIDNVNIRDTSSGRFIYRQVLGPGVNPYGAANAQGIYWIDCGGNNVIIERSRIQGTLVLLNPGSGSRIAHGPIHLAPSKPGYPSLIVHGNFTIGSTTRGLNEAECGESGTNFNPAGFPFDFNNPLISSTDNIPDDIYPSEIQGLVAVSGNLTFENQPRVRGQVIAGGTITGSPSLQHRLDAVYSPPPGFTGDTAYERRPASIRKVVLP